MFYILRTSVLDITPEWSDASLAGLLEAISAPPPAPPLHTHSLKPCPQRPPAAGCLTHRAFLEQMNPVLLVTEPVVHPLCLPKVS